MVAVIAPIVEEIVFRGVIYHGIVFSINHDTALNNSNVIVSTTIRWWIFFLYRLVNERIVIP
ncbi:hypothetical protein DL897_14285 [Thermoflavimicrobium daqui]|uniref:Uncharacterized protein n=2 Tax=Thermoflavimicrobium daqui TaxID=2137476 RepID=A0A364K2C8_9BACL|nr:hypothetical protein DL897_14285 [Thermoflavimicrobium daqui]